LLGNKCDVTNRVLSKEDGEEYGKKFECDFLEISALKDINIKEGFELILRDNLKREKIDQNKKDRDNSFKHKKKGGCIIL